MMLEKYDAAVASGRLTADSAQRALAQRLDALARELNFNSKLNFIQRLFAPRTAVKGLYIWGGVGRGKTMLMDMFYDALISKKKRRVHFHAFMQEVHQAIFQERQTRENDRDPVEAVAREISIVTRILCFDEFAVTDIADAMILSRLFRILLEQGVVVIATSNIQPKNLYKDGLNRALFEPFITLLKTHMDVVRIDDGLDYRLANLEKSGVYFIGENSDREIDAAWRQYTKLSSEQCSQLQLRGRSLNIPRTASGIARFHFSELCEAPLSAEDYLEIASCFHTLFIEYIPFFKAEHKNALRRFINLIDILYDHRVKLVTSAAARPQDLVQEMAGYEALAFERTASRLIEMRSSAYLALPHISSASGL